MILAGHGKTHLDAEFGIPKNALTTHALVQGATNGNSVISTSEDAVQFLKKHEHFSPQMQPRKDDRLGFALTTRDVDNANLNCVFGKIVF